MTPAHELAPNTREKTLQDHLDFLFGLLRAEGKGHKVFGADKPLTTLVCTTEYLHMEGRVDTPPSFPDNGLMVIQAKSKKGIDIVGFLKSGKIERAADEILYITREMAMWGRDFYLTPRTKIVAYDSVAGETVTFDQTSSGDWMSLNQEKISQNGAQKLLASIETLIVTS